MLDNIEARIETLEDAVFARPRNALIASLLSVKRNILELRRWTAKQREVLLRLGRREFALISAEDALLFRDVHDHLVRINDLLEGFRDMLTSIQEAYLSAISNRTNDIMRFLTLFSTIMMPLTVLTGVYGMNFEHMPELRSVYGYPMVLIGMLVIIGSSLLYFRHRGWLGRPPRVDEDAGGDGDESPKLHSPPAHDVPPDPRAEMTTPPTTVVVSATRAEQAGASMRIAGLTIAERAIKQLAQAPDTRVIVATDGTVVLPAPAARQRGDPDRERCRGGRLRRGGNRREAGRRRRRPRRARDAGTRVTDEAGRRAAEDAVFAALFRPDLGFVARRLNKPISVPLTRRILVATAITPNQITLIAAAFGLVGCALIASGRYAVMVAGFACQQIQSILDGCDGELARVRMQQSKLGAWLDTFVDDVLNVLITVRSGSAWRAPAPGRGRRRSGSRAARCWSHRT